MVKWGAICVRAPLYQTRMAPREILTRPFTVTFQIHFNGIGVSSYLAMVPFEQVAWMGRHMNRFMDLVRGDPESFKHESNSKLGQISQSVFRRYGPPLHLVIILDNSHSTIQLNNNDHIHPNYRSNTHQWCRRFGECFWSWFNLQRWFKLDMKNWMNVHVNVRFI